jgi:hypothetical protein
MKILKTIPVFRTEDEEREFWSTADTTDYLSRCSKYSWQNGSPMNGTGDPNYRVILPSVIARRSSLGLRNGVVKPRQYPIRHAYYPDSGLA